MLAGPNGAGKSTFYDTFLRDAGLPYLNPDALTAFDPAMTGDQIRQAADGIRAAFFKNRASFITETVFSDTVGAKIRFLRAAIKAGYDVRLIYIGLISAELSERRVQSRVAAKGHDAPRHKLGSRFERSLRNLDRPSPSCPTSPSMTTAGRTNPIAWLPRSGAASSGKAPHGQMPSGSTSGLQCVA